MKEAMLHKHCAPERKEAAMLAEAQIFKQT